MNLIERVRRTLAARGARGLALAAYRKLARTRWPEFDRHADHFRARPGLEIGGPSDVFRRNGLFPIYAIADRLDNCNFGRDTIWEGHIAPGATFQYDRAHAPGTQFIAEATALAFARDESYAFVASSHALEHVANPLKALFEWKRVLRGGGLLALVLPDRDGTFDHRRPVTTMEHLLRDHRADVGEDDPTHVEEILALHDFARDPEARDRQAFAERAHHNIENRGLHHHVFDEALARALVLHAGFEVLSTRRCAPFHIFVVARKPAPFPVSA